MSRRYDKTFLIATVAWLPQPHPGTRQGSSAESGKNERRSEELNLSAKIRLRDRRLYWILRAESDGMPK